MSQTKALIEPILKEYLIEGIEDSLPRWSVLYDMAQKKGKHQWSGKYFRKPVHVQGNNSFVSMAEDGTLPDAGQQTYRDYQGEAKQMALRIQMTMMAMAASKKDKGAFAEIFSEESERGEADAVNQISRQMYGSQGGTLGVGQLAVITNTANSTTFEFDTGTQQDVFENGDVLDLHDATFANEIAANLTVASLTWTNKEHTAGSFTSTQANKAAGQLLVLRDAVVAGGTPVYNEMTGINAAIGGDGTYGQTTYYGQSRSTYPTLQSQIYAPAAQTDLTDAMLYQACALVRRRAGGGVIPTDVVTTDGVLNVYGQTLKTLDRFSDSNLVGGWKFIRFLYNGKEVKLFDDRWAIPHTALGFVREHLHLMELDGMGWMDDDGAVLARVSGKTQYEAVLVYMANVLYARPNEAFRIPLLNEYAQGAV